MVMELVGPLAVHLYGTVRGLFFGRRYAAGVLRQMLRKVCRGGSAS